MTTIAATSTDTTLINGAQTGSTASTNTEAADATTNTEETNTATPTIETAATKPTDVVEISTRAQKIQKLNEEFFTAGPRAFKVTPEFIDRLKEYGLISAGEADKLGATAAQAENSSQGAKTVDELSLFITSFTDSVEQVAPDHPIIDALKQAQIILDNFNQPNSASTAINIADVMQKITDYDDTSTDLLPKADRESFDQLQLALSVASKLTAGTNTTAEIDHYLTISNL